MNQETDVVYDREILVVWKGGIWLMSMFKTPKEYDLVECSDVVGPVVCLMYFFFKLLPFFSSNLYAITRHPLPSILNSSSFLMFPVLRFHSRNLISLLILFMITISALETSQRFISSSPYLNHQIWRLLECPSACNKGIHWNSFVFFSLSLSFFALRLISWTTFCCLRRGIWCLPWSSSGMGYC